MATIARIIVTDPDLKNKRQLFSRFIAESKQHLPNGKKHQFVLLPAGFVQFAIKSDLTNTPLSEPNDNAAKRKWNTEIESLKDQALAEFHRSFDSKLLKELKSVANHLVVGIDGKAAPKNKGRHIEFVLVYDLQADKPLHWTGKAYPQSDQRNSLIKMPIETHFIKRKIGGKKVAVLDCNDLSIFNPRQQQFFSPFKNELKDNRRVDTPTGKIKCPFIDATLDFNPDIVLQLAHTEGTWAAKWTKFNTWLQRKNGKELQHFASGLKKNSKDKKQYSLSGTQRGDVINFVNGQLADE